MAYFVIAIGFFIFGLLAAALLGMAGRESRERELEMALEAEYERGFRAGIVAMDRIEAMAKEER